jgi:POTRA domain, FtsQ-type
VTGGRTRRSRPSGTRRPGAVGRLRGRGRLLRPARAAGLLGMLVAGVGLKLLTGAAAFGLTEIDHPTLTWTAADTVLASVQVPTGTNLFQIETAPIEARLAALPAVAVARVSVSLPNALTITIRERVPILAWQIGDGDYLVDDAGVLFAAVDATAASAARIPIVVDRRAASPGGLILGATLDPVDFDAASRLGGIVPADVGSAAATLHVWIDDADGFTMNAGAGTWTAVFGFYSPSVRSTDLIPGQVRLLRSLLADRESSVARIYLASDRSGTYVPKPTPK